MDRVDLLGLCIVILAVGLIVTNINLLSSCNDLANTIEEITKNAIILEVNND